MNILLVEDDADLRLLVQSILVEAGHDVWAFGDAESAWDSCRSGCDFPLMILDWGLPGMDGLEFCRRVRQSPDGERHVIVVVTARQEPDALKQILDAGADDYIPKPFTVDFFEVRLEIAERHVEQLRARRTAEAAARATAQLQGALLAATTMEHHLGNQLALTMGYCELLAKSEELPPHLVRFATVALDGVDRATETLRQLRRIIRLEEATDTAGPKHIDVERSAV